MNDPIAHLRSVIADIERELWTVAHSQQQEIRVEVKRLENWNQDIREAVIALTRAKADAK